MQDEIRPWVRNWELKRRHIVKSCVHEPWDDTRRTCLQRAGRIEHPEGTALRLSQTIRKYLTEEANTKIGA